MTAMQVLGHPVFYSVLGALILTIGGNLLCRLLFWAIGLSPVVASPAAPSAAPPMPDRAVLNPAAGRWIGILERMIMAAGMLSGSWEVLAAVIALKTIARFKEIDEQLQAEYFLVGSLFSVLWTLAVTGLWSFYDRVHGANLAGMMSAG